MNKLLKFISVWLLAACLFGCANPDIETTVNIPVTAGTESTTEETEVPTPAVEEKRISFAAVGDNLLHNTVTYSAQIEKGKFDFSPIYKDIGALAGKYDLAFVNQEIPLGGVELGISGYPTFNGPAEAADGLFGAGFDIINVASNHSLDKGMNGLLASLENIKAAGFDKIVGAFPDEENLDDFLIFEQDGVKIGMLSYTYGTNGIPLPQSNPNIVPLIDTDKITADVEKIRDDCDVLIVSMHWGTEYKLSPTDNQKELASLLNELGVDVIIGHHPHVIEPVEVLTSSSGHETVCFYSLGNFVSNQHDAPTMLGGMASFEIVKTIEGDIEIQNYGVLPIVTHFNSNASQFNIYPLDNYTEDMANAHGINKYDSRFGYNYLHELADEVLQEYRLTVGDLEKLFND